MHKRVVFGSRRCMDSRVVSMATLPLGSGLSLFRVRQQRVARRAFSISSCVPHPHSYANPMSRVLLWQAAASIQAAVRGRLERKAFLRARNASAVLQAWTRGRLQRMRYLALIRQVKKKKTVFVCFFQCWK